MCEIFRIWYWFDFCFFVRQRYGLTKVLSFKLNQIIFQHPVLIVWGFFKMNINGVNVIGWFKYGCILSDIIPLTQVSMKWGLLKGRKRCQSYWRPTGARIISPPSCRARLHAEIWSEALVIQLTMRRHEKYPFNTKHNKIFVTADALHHQL